MFSLIKMAAAVAYVLKINGEHHETGLLSTKSKVVPKKCVLIPRRELQAAVIGVQLVRMLKESYSIKFSSCIFCTNSRNIIAGSGRRRSLRPLLLTGLQRYAN